MIEKIRNGLKMKKKRLKILITLLTLSMLGVLSIPFSKYFGLASHSQLIKKPDITNTLPERIAEPELIEAPNLRDVVKSYSNKDKTAVGQVIIPSASVNQPIFIGLTKENMARGVVSLFPKRQPDQQSLTLIGHHVQYDSSLLFGGVQSLKKHADVYVRYFDEYYSYKVESNRIIKETDLAALEDKGPNYLLLITCNSATTTPYRVLVTAKKVATPSKKAHASFTHQKEIIQKAHSKTYWIKFLLPLFFAIFLSGIFLIYIWKF
ncbi:class A sortase [Lactococcus muris]|uniref:Class A sortase n=1 Tax=Lactococcus muris TaxID=2941330 RepID=A0ABV4D878_9LACT